MSLVVGTLAFSVFLFVLAFFYLYVNSRGERDGDQSAVHVAENCVQEGAQENAQGYSEGKAKEEEGEMRKHPDFANKDKRIDVFMPQAGQTVLAAATSANGNVKSTETPGTSMAQSWKSPSAFPAPAGSVFPEAQAATNNVMLPVHQEFPKHPKHNVQRFGQGVSQSFFAGTGESSSGNIGQANSFGGNVNVQTYGQGVHNTLPAANGGLQFTPSFGAGAPIGPFNAQNFGAVLPQSFNGTNASSQAKFHVSTNNVQSFGSGVPQSLSAPGGGSQFTPSFVAGAPIGPFNAENFGAVLPETSNAASTGSQTNAVQRGLRIFNSCQARVNLWDLMVFDNSCVERIELLGQGAYAEVYGGKVRGLKCAIKLYRSTASEKQLKEAMREIRLMASLDHPCTLRLIGWVKQPLQTITELCLGDLKDFYNDKIGGLQYSEVRALVLLRVGFRS